MDIGAIFPYLPKQLHPLGQMAENLWWTWHPEARMLYKSLDRRAWKEFGHNPDKMLKSLSPERFEAAMKDPVYMARLNAVYADFSTATGAR
jgi:starch phosphorylase